MQREYDAHDETGESQRQYLDDRMDEIGIDIAFRAVDCTDVDVESEEIDLVSDTVTGETQKLDMSIPDEENEGETFARLSWHANGFVGRITSRVASKLDDEDIETVESISDAVTALQLTENKHADIHVFFHPSEDGFIGTVPAMSGLVFETNTIPADRALVVNTNKFGYRIDTKELETVVYDDEERPQNVLRAEIGREYVIENPEMARWIDIS